MASQLTQEKAHVTEVTDERIVVSSQVKSACHQCHQSDTCGSGIVAKAIPQKALTLSLPKSNVANGIKPKVGDEVLIALPEKALLSSAFTVYLFPLFGLIIFGFLGQQALEMQIISHELIGLAVSVIGGFTGFKLAKWRQNRLACQQGSDYLQPTILKVIASSQNKTTIDVVDLS